ncbi:MAG: hypothetical protein HY063_09430 [Bacteroidetes bacterium]|nr:hypothetical protein [Bacteroidota bacterium]
MQKKIEERENVKLRKDWFVHLYQEIKKSFTPKEQEEMKKQINLYKRRVTTDSVLLLRTLIAIIIFYLTIDYFGWLLLLILLTILIISFVLLVIGYQMAELLPIGIRRISAEIEQYIKDNYPEE